MKPFDPFADSADATSGVSTTQTPFTPFAQTIEAPSPAPDEERNTPFTPLLNQQSGAPTMVDFTENARSSPAQQLVISPVFETESAEAGKGGVFSPRSSRPEPAPTTVVFPECPQPSPEKQVAAAPVVPVFVYQPEIQSSVSKVKPAVVVDHAFNAFEHGELSAKEQATALLAESFGPACEREVWFKFSWGWLTGLCRDGEKHLQSWLKEAGAKNQHAHDQVTDLHQDYDRLNSITSIENAHKLIAGTLEKKWFQRNTTDPHQIEAHLSVIQQAIPGLKSRVTQLLEHSRQLMLETGAVCKLSQVTPAKSELESLVDVAERVYLLHQSASLLVPDLLLLERDLQQQGDDVETLVTITLPLWRRKQSRGG